MRSYSDYCDERKLTELTVRRLKRIIGTDPSVPAENTLRSAVELLERQEKEIAILESRVVEAESNPRLRHPGGADYVLALMDDERRDALLECVKSFCAVIYSGDALEFLHVAKAFRHLDIQSTEFAAALAIHGMSFADDFDEIEFEDAFMEDAVLE